MIDFDTYIRMGEPGGKERAEAWKTAIGLQAVDGLKTSEYLNETAAKHIEGDITIDQVKDLIDTYYQSKTARTPEDDEVEEFKIVTTVRGNSLKNLVSTESPIGKAVFGHKVGDRVWVEIDQNAGYFVEIKSIHVNETGDEEELRKF